MQRLIKSLRQHPEAALFLVLALGYLILALGALAVVRLVGPG